MLRVMLISLTAWSLANSSAGESPIDVGGRKQLFIDRRFIATCDEIKLQTNPAQKLGRIKDESGNYYREHINKVLDVDGRFRLYLGADHAEVIESEDGMTFRRTGVNLPGEFPTIFFDEHEQNPKRRYNLRRER